MKHIISLLFLAGLCFASVSAVPPTKAQLQALEKLMMNAPLQEEDPEFDDGDETSRMWNPFSWMSNKLKNKCKCEDLKCECCFKFKIFHNVACLSAETLPEEKKLKITFKMDEDEMVNKKFDIDRNDQLCGSVPSPFGFAKFCFTQQSELATDLTVTSCSTIDFRIGGTVGAVLQFRCLELKDRKISFGGFKEIEKKNMLVLKAKNPFKAAVALYRKTLGKKN